MSNLRLSYLQKVWGGGGYISPSPGIYASGLGRKGRPPKKKKKNHGSASVFCNDRALPYAYWVCAARETPIFSPKFPFRSISSLQIFKYFVPEHHQFKVFCRSGDHNFRNFAAQCPPDASYSPFRRPAFSRSSSASSLQSPALVFTLELPELAPEPSIIRSSSIRSPPFFTLPRWPRQCRKACMHGSLSF